MKKLTRFLHIGVITVVLAQLTWLSDGQCTFPTELQGIWLSSKKGELNITASKIQGFNFCENARGCGALPTEVDCIENAGDQYLVVTPSYEDSNDIVKVYSCLYFTRISSVEYIYYQGPEEKQRFFSDYVTAVLETDMRTLADICDLPNPIPVTRYNMLVKKDSVSTAASYCPTDFLGSYLNTKSSCTVQFNVCNDKTRVQVSNTSCSPLALYTAGGSMVCIYSLAEGSVTYLTLYNEDTTVDGADTFQFTCLAILKDTSNEVYLIQQARDCDGLGAPNSATANYIGQPQELCPITCNFASSLQGSWLSNRKGNITVSQDALYGFEPYGVNCDTTTCTTAAQPDEFECYLKSENLYLIRSALTSINGLSVKIYVCVDFVLMSANKHVFYQMHSSVHPDLDEYVVTLNGAVPVDSIGQVCQENTFSTQLYTVLIPSVSPTSAAQDCPEGLGNVYNTTDNTCDYSFATCTDSTEISMTSTSCNPSPFYTTGGVLSCIYSVISNGVTYLTLYNQDSSVDDTNTFQMSCMAFQLFGTNLAFSQTAGGCEVTQTANSINTLTGSTFSFVYLETCPIPSELVIWPYIVAAILIILVIALIVLLCYCCRKRKWCGFKKEKTDEENVIGSDDKPAKRERGDAAQPAVIHGEAGKGERSPFGLFKEQFTVVKKKKAHVRSQKRSRFRHKRKRGGNEGEDFSYESSDTKDGETDKKKSRRRRRRKHGDAEDGGSHTSTSDDYSSDFTSDDESYSSSFQSDEAEEGGSKKKKRRRKKKMDPRFALAWMKRENNPTLVQDDNVPRTREDHEKELEQKEASKPPGKVVSIRAVFEKAGWQRKNRKSKKRRIQSVGRKRRGSILSTAKYPPGARPTMIQGKVRPGRAQPDPYINLYHKYKNAKEHMEDEGYWDAGKSAEDQFGFTKDEKELAGSSDQDKSEPDDSGGDSEAKDHTNSDSDGLPAELKAKKPAKRVVISSVPPASTIIPDSDDTGIDSSSTSRSSTLNDIRMDGNWRKTEPKDDFDKKSQRKQKTSKSGKGTESDAIPADQDIPSATDTRASSAQERSLAQTPTNPDLMSRFYARLQELKAAKEDDNQTTTTTDAITRSKDRKRIKTALRRLLADRLFPEEAKSKRSKTARKQYHAYQPVGDGFTSGTLTPLTSGSRSKTNLSTREGGSTRATTCLGSQGQGRVVFVNERTQLTPTEEIDKQPSQHGEQKEEQADLLPDEQVSYYRRHPLGTLKNGQVSRLYQPPTGPQRAKTSLSQISIRQGLRNDKAFLQRLQGDQGIRTETRWSVPGEYAPDRGRDEQLNPEHSSWRRERADVAWTYNMQSRNGQAGDQEGDGEQGRRYGRLNLKDLDDWHLRRLLEELYKDKKYMDKIIETTEQEDEEELEVSLRMEGGRDYLLERAYYWLEKGPLPPRPPTTELGYKLEKLRAKTASQTGSESPLPKQPSLPPGRGNSTMSSSTIRTTTTMHNVKTINADRNTVQGEIIADSQTKQEAPINNEYGNSKKKENNQNIEVDDSRTVAEESKKDQNPSQHTSANHESHSSHDTEDQAANEKDKNFNDRSPTNDRAVNVYSSAEGRAY